jgi:integrase
MKALAILPAPTRGKFIAGAANKLQVALKPVRLADLRFHDLRHTWASWHRQAGTSCDELKDLGGWKSRQMADRYAKYSTEHLAAAAARIENGRGGNVVELSRFRHVQDRAA